MKRLLTILCLLAALAGCDSRAARVRQFNDEYQMSVSFQKERNCRNEKEANWIRLGMDETHPDAFNDIKAERIEWETRFNRQANLVGRLANTMDHTADR